jgi:hypothetical protein
MSEQTKMGRPKKIIDQEQFEALCEIQCTQVEICSVLKVTEKTLNKWVDETYGDSFSNVFKTKSGTGKMSLRRLQFESARKGNTTMLIWLGKQYLGQSDKSEVTENLATVKLDSLIEQLEQDDSNTEA